MGTKVDWSGAARCEAVSLSWCGVALGLACPNQGGGGARWWWWWGGGSEEPPGEPRVRLPR
eukprot:638062-Prymnesium_polylepis.1